RRFFASGSSNLLTERSRPITIPLTERQPSVSLMDRKFSQTNLIGAAIIGIIIIIGARFAPGRFTG
ncbi:MAG: hypothetical protein ACOC6A_07260, partial [Chloroflexota bacterium]